MDINMLSSEVPGSHNFGDVNDKCTKCRGISTERGGSPSTFGGFVSGYIGISKGIVRRDPIV